MEHARNNATPLSVMGGHGTLGRHNKTTAFPRAAVDYLHDVYKLLLVIHCPVDLQAGAERVNNTVTRAHQC